MSIKTKEFHRKFLYDLKNIIINDKLYEEELKNFNVDNSNLTLFKSKTVKFIGSYSYKEFGTSISDIDVPQYIKKNIGPRFRHMIKNIDKTPFIFLHINCGYDIEVKVPWKFNEFGDS
jgi:hypothetical protein